MTLVAIQDPALLTGDRKREAQQLRQCCWCAKPIAGRRSWWCGDECVADFQARKQRVPPQHLVFNRDHGICAICGLDCPKLHREWHDRRVTLQEFRFSRGHEDEILGREWERDMPGWPKWESLRQRNRWWEIDHIHQVARGGKTLGMQNIRTLCIPCHRRVTAEFRAEHTRELAAKRLRQEVMDLGGHG